MLWDSDETGLTCDQEDPELALELGSDMERRAGRAVWREKGIRAGKYKGQRDRASGVTWHVFSEAGHGRIMLAGYVRAGSWKAWKAWPRSLDVTQASRSHFFFQVFEQEGEMIEMVLQGSWSFRDRRELIVQCFSNSSGI